jgi:hypothetical protein
MKHISTLAIVSGLLLTSAVAQARQNPGAPQRPTPPRVTQPQRPAGQQPSIDVLYVNEQDARATRDELRRILEQYPPQLRQVLRLDYGLLAREDYLATYPTLAAFLKQHPEVLHAPAFYVGMPDPNSDWNNTPQAEMARTVRHLTEVGGVIAGIMTVTFGLVWLIRTLLEQRRWQRASRAQAELHARLVDRFSSSEELLGYLQSPAGQALVQPPAMPASAPRGIDAPLNRIFWSVQIGVVVAAAGGGLLLVSRHPMMISVHPAFFAMGVLAASLGVGFLISSAISFILSQRLGLLHTSSARYSGETPGS